METIRGYDRKRRAISFKSYYVVWKLYGIRIYFFSPCVFKSYYVVWKHIAPAPAIIAFSLFKSYYVVWKLRREGVYGAVR